MTQTTPPDSPEWRAFSRELRRRESQADFEALLDHLVDVSVTVERAHSVIAALDDHLEEARMIEDELTGHLERIAAELARADARRRR